MLPELDPLLHAQLRLAIMSTLVSRSSINFPELRELLDATSGNLSVQMKKLEKARYLTIEKGYHNNYPQTTLKITEKGLEAFEEYVDALSKYLPK